MDKKRLEYIKEKYSEVTVLEYINDIEIVGVDMKDLVWLIQQAERVQKLEKELDEALDIGLKMEGEAIEWERKAKRYKQALEFYANEETYETKFATDTDEIYDPFTLIELDKGKKHVKHWRAKGNE